MLTVNEIRSIFQKTSRLDDFCLRAPGGPIQSGFGKVDGVAGMKEVLSISGIETIRQDKPTSPLIFNLFGQPVGEQTNKEGLLIKGGRKILL